MTDDHDDASAAPAPETPPPWLEELCQTAYGLRELALAQWQLLGAELRLARAAAWALLVAALLATVSAVALGLTLLALLGFALAHWFGSWIWALIALAALLVLVLVAAIVLFRRCLHWLSMPGTRAQWRSLTRGSVPSSSASRTPGHHGEISAHDDTSQAG